MFWFVDRYTLRLCSVLRILIKQLVDKLTYKKDIYFMYKQWKLLLLLRLQPCCQVS